MNNSEAYQFLLRQLNATGREKMDGYGVDILENIYNWEREEVEKIMWIAFTQKHEYGLAYYMPKLKNYDGMTALIDTFKKCNMPSYNSTNIASILYSVTNNRRYLDILKKNYSLVSNKSATISIISRLAKYKDVYSFLINVFINSEDEVSRDSAIEGVLWSKGFIKDINSLTEFFEKKSLFLMFDKDTPTERKEMIEKLEKGEFDKYK